MNWVSKISELPLEPEAKILNWLTKPFILTQALRRVCHTLTVNVLSQVQAEDLSLVRKVLLEGDGVPWVYAIVDIPSGTYQNHQAAFDSLGSKPIGETLLYNNPNVQRSDFEYGFMEDQRLWGRRSIFTLDKGRDPLSITEFFLPALPDYCE